MKGFKSFTKAAITIAGIELVHRIHERQFSFGLGVRPRYVIAHLLPKDAPHADLGSDWAQKSAVK
jgi:hypothetical protein